MGIDFQWLKAVRGLDLTVWPPQYNPGYRPHPDEEYWMPEIECATAADRDEIVFWKLRQQVSYAWERSPFYRRHWQEAGISPQSLKSLDDLALFPVVQKTDLRAAQETRPPFGDLLCIESGQIARIHGTSGTTGRPVVFAIGNDDWGRIANVHAKAMWAAGLRPADRIIVCSVFGLYVGSWGALVGGERLGAAMFPFGAGLPGLTLRALEWIQAVRPTALYATPSYALHLAETARQEAVDPHSLGFRILFFSGEPGAGIPETKRLIENTFGASCIDMGSMAEMTPWMTNAECDHRQGMHLCQDVVYAQVCDPVTFKPLPFGSEGTLVYTHLERTSQPMIRLASNDRTRWVDAPCLCGRSYPRLPDGIYGRYDDMFVIRGENIYPSAIEDTLRGIEGFGGEFQMVISREESMDELVVQAEYTPTHSNQSSVEELRATMKTRLRVRLGVRTVVELFPQGALPRSQLKSRRTVDNRDLYRSLTANCRQPK